MKLNTKIGNILFLDIETVPQYEDKKSLSKVMQKLWKKKANRIVKKDKNKTDDEIYKHAGIFAEFGKIVCISTAFFHKDKLRVKSFYSDDEELLLKHFTDLLVRFFNKRANYLCAHNGKEFDFPYIARRMLINNIALPEILAVAGKKPWETRFLDTLELWKFGDYKHYTSLELLTTIFNIQTPKNDIDGSQVCDVYWKDKDLKRIKEYCERDVVAVVMLLQKYLGRELIKNEDIIVVD